MATGENLHCQVPDAKGLGGIALWCVRKFCGCPRPPLGHLGCAISVSIAVPVTMVILFWVITYIVSVIQSLKRDRNLRRLSMMPWALKSALVFAIVIAYSVRKWLLYLVLLSFLGTLGTGILRAYGIANDTVVGVAMALDFLCLCAISIIMSVLAANPVLKRGSYTTLQKLLTAGLKDTPDAQQIMRDPSRKFSFEEGRQKDGFRAIQVSFEEQCTKVGHELVKNKRIEEKDVLEISSNYMIGLTGVVLWRALLRSSRDGVEGIILADGTEVKPDVEALKLGENVAIQFFMTLRSQVREARLLFRTELTDQFELKLLGYEVGLAAFEDQKRTACCKSLLQCCNMHSTAPPRINDIYSKVYDITVKITQLQIFHDRFMKFQASFVESLSPDRNREVKDFMKAAQNGDQDKVMSCLKTLDVNTKTDKNATALICAAMSDQLDVVRLLIEKRADVNAHTADTRSALWLASFRGNADVVNELLKASADQNKLDFYKLSPIMAAEKKGHGTVVDLLRKHGEREMNKNSSALRQWEEYQAMRIQAQAYESDRSPSNLIA